MNFEKTIILCRPETSANIGAVCRVMANTGFKDLRITGSKEDYDETEVLKLALHASHVWKNAHFYPPTIEGLKEAASDCSVLIGTSRRTGHKRKDLGISPEDLCLDLKRFYGGRLGLVFGNERTGLIDEELNLCSFSVNIPAEEEFGSYNLSHAVLIICYSLYIAEKNNLIAEKDNPPTEKNIYLQKASMKMIQENSEQICKYLSGLGLFKKGGKKINETFFTELLSSAGASEFDTMHLTEIFKKLFFMYSC